ncbi:hypothetical protein FQN54_002366 [Arachnomyces sp. PD_36]|nr:hypothetical protein FQN54_002366 [Arachnomyces sp. PD_36]
MDSAADPESNPDPDADYGLPCMRCAQRAVSSKTLMTGSNLCCFVKDTPCYYCSIKKTGPCLPPPPELRPLVLEIMNLVDSLDDDKFSSDARRAVVEKGLALGKELRNKWATFQKRAKNEISVDGSEDIISTSNNEAEWVAKQNSEYLELAKESLARQGRTNDLLEEQNALLSQQSALLNQIWEKQSAQFDRLSELTGQLVSDGTKHSAQIVSQLQSNARDLQGSRVSPKPVTDPKPPPTLFKPVLNREPRIPRPPTPNSEASERSQLLNSFVGKPRKRMSSSTFPDTSKRADTRSFTG